MRIKVSKKDGYVPFSTLLPLQFSGMARSALVFFLLVLQSGPILSQEAKGESISEAEQKYHDSSIFSVVPVLSSQLLGGSDAGGAYDEQRSKNRILLLADAGAKIRYQNSMASYFINAGISGLVDYTKYSKSSHYFFQHYYPGNLSFGVSSIKRTDAEPPGEENETDLKDIHGFFTNSDLFNLQDTFYAGGFAGYQWMTENREGLLFHGRTPGGRVHLGGNHLSSMTGGWIKGSELGFFHMEVDREIRMNEKSGKKNRFRGADLTFRFRSFTLSFLYGLYTSPGRYALTHPGGIILNRYEPQNLIDAGIREYLRELFVHDISALPRRRIHYYSMRMEGGTDSIHFLVAGYHNFGREYIPRPGDAYDPPLKDTVQGTLLYGHILYGWGGGSVLPPCPGGNERLRSCIRPYGDLDRWNTEFSILWSTRDETKDDRINKGYSPVRSAVTVLGGITSIIISGPPPFREKSVVENRQRGLTLYQDFPDNANEVLDAPDNMDTGYPLYTNGGLKAVSVALGYHYLSYRPGIRFTYGRYLNGVAYEGIVSMEARLNRWDLELGAFFAATGMSYRSTVWDNDPYTGLLRRTDPHYYSRYTVGLTVYF